MKLSTIIILLLIALSFYLHYVDTRNIDTLFGHNLTNVKKLQDIQNEVNTMNIRLTKLEQKV